MVEIPPAHKSSCVHFMGSGQGEMQLLDGHKIELVPFLVQRFVYPFHSLFAAAALVQDEMKAIFLPLRPTQPFLLRVEFVWISLSVSPPAAALC